jgi:peroxiredoxin
MLDLGTKAPDFSLPDVVTGNRVTLETFDNAEALVVIFMCNHCPYVKHLRSGIVTLTHDYREKGVEVVAISSNDADKYPDDSPEKMAEEAKRYKYPFPYLYDESQEIAKAYQAACTPDFYVFDSNRKLVYRGQFDESRPGNDEPVTGSDVRKALDLLLKEGKVRDIQKPSVGCNIKWKPGNEPEYFG